MESRQYREIPAAVEARNEPRVFIALPCYGPMPCETVEALLRANSELPFPHTIRFLKGNSCVSSARNALAAQFLEGSCTHLLFVDSDMVFTPAQVIRLMSHSEAIVGGLYSQKQLKNSFNIQGRIGDDVRDWVMQVRRVGTGFLSIRRDVLEAMISAFGSEIEYIHAGYGLGEGHRQWNFFGVGVRLDEDGIPRLFSEDFYFCERARELGFKVYVDLRVILGHIGQVTFPLCGKWSMARKEQTQECERLAREGVLARAGKEHSGDKS